MLSKTFAAMYAVSVHLAEGIAPPQFGELRAEWGYGSRHDGERYEVHLCEGCFFSALATLKEERRACRMFDENEQDAEAAEFGLVVLGDNG